MTTQDLSLLTEFERGLWRSLRDSDQDIPAYSTHHMRVVLSHLIASRAENKRKDEVLQILTADMYPKKDTYGGGSSGMFAEFCIDDVYATCVLTNVDPKDAEAFVRVRAALLQSEKGGAE